MASDGTKDGVQLKDEGRRNLLKVATVAGGAVAASALLPGSWEKPVATIGGLPAHAQTSGFQSITIADVAARLTGWPVEPPVDNDASALVTADPNGPDIGVYCEYEDTFDDFGMDHQITYTVTQLTNGVDAARVVAICGQPVTVNLGDVTKYWEGGAFSGKLWLAVYSGGCEPPGSITLSIHKGADHVSNEVTVQVQLPS